MYSGSLLSDQSRRTIENCSENCSAFSPAAAAPLKIFISCGGGGGRAGFGSGSLDGSRASLANALPHALAPFGHAVLVDTPRRGIRAARRAQAVHLCLAMPHELPPHAGRETIPVFGLPVADCPTAVLGGEAFTGWAARLAQAGRAICFSDHAAEAVRRLMGPEFPVAVAAPALDCAALAVTPATLRAHGALLDTASWPATCPPEESMPPERQKPPLKTVRFRLGTIRLHLMALYREAVADLLPVPVRRLVARLARLAASTARRMLARHCAAQETAEGRQFWRQGPADVSLQGLVIAAIHGAFDGSWSDLLSAFITVFRNEGDATLAVKTDPLDPPARAGLAAMLRRLGPFACRVVILAGDVEGGLGALIEPASFIASASHSEPAPWPMLRFMAAGRPAIAPAHGGLAGIVEPRTGFVVASGPDYESFPGDASGRLAATGWRLEWESLCDGLRAASDVWRVPAAYQARAAATAAHLKLWCGRHRVNADLVKVLSALT